MEKLRNILHDFGDIFIALIIALLMFSVVSWNLGDWFDDNTTTNVTIHDDTNIENINNLPKIEDLHENPSPDTDEQDIAVPETKEVIIPSGTPSSGIADILKDNNLIKDTEIFLKTVDDLDLASKLRSGTFEVPSEATVEEVIKIIAKSN